MWLVSLAGLTAGETSERSIPETADGQASSHMPVFPGETSVDSPDRSLGGRSAQPAAGLGDTCVHTGRALTPPAW